MNKFFGHHNYTTDSNNYIISQLTLDLSKNGEIMKLKKITVNEYSNTNKNINTQLVLLKIPNKNNIIVLANDSTIT